LFVELDGVILAAKPVVTQVLVDVVVVCVVDVTCTTCNTVPAVVVVLIVPPVVGSVIVLEPATAGAAMVTDPDVSPLITNELIGLPNVNRLAGLPPRQNLM
jgi:hypothetical protein